MPTPPATKEFGPSREDNLESLRDMMDILESVNKKLSSFDI